jgi:signal transduction histidine kinase
VLAVVLLAGGAAAIATSIRITSPTTGAAIPTSRQSISALGIDVDVLPDVNGPLRTGDVVFAIAGRPLEAWAGDLLDPAAPRLRAAVGDTVRMDVRRGGEALTVDVPLVAFPAFAVIFSGLGTLSFVFLMLAVAIVVFALRPFVAASGALLVAAVGAAGSTVPFLLSQDPLDLTTGAFVVEFPAVTFVYGLLWAGLIDFLLVFPRPFDRLARRPALRLIPYVAILGGTALLAILAAATSPNVLAAIGAVAAASVLWPLVTFLAMPVVLIVRWRRGPVDDRRVLRGFAYVIGFIVIVDAIVWVIPETLGRPPLLPWTVSGLIGLPFPFLIAAAIVRHGAFDIDVVVRRSLVYGGLTLVVLVTYVTAATLLSTLVSGQSPFATALLATGVATLVALPVRDVLQRAVRRLLYGDRDEPVRAIRRLGERLESSLDPRSMPDTVVSTVADALRLPYVALELRTADGPRLAAVRGQPTPEVIERPVRFGSRGLGRLIVGPRGPSDPLSAADLHLLDDLARQVGIATHAAELTEDLKASRERIVTAREEERRRLRRDLHDGLGPALAAIGMRAEAADQLMTSDPAASQQLLDELRSEVADAVADVRRLVDGLRPPALDELGLVDAVRLVAERLASGGGLTISVEGKGALGELPAAIEVAAYRIATEAMTNSVRHADASRCQVRFEAGLELLVVVEDDGSGLPADHPEGQGLASMHERAAELGGECITESGTSGGTRVVARLPIGPHPIASVA